MLNRQPLFHIFFPLIALGAWAIGILPASAADSGAKMLARKPKPNASTPNLTNQIGNGVIMPSPMKEPLKPVAEARQVLDDSTWGQVNGESVNVRLGPGTQNPIVATLRGGEYVKARAMQGAWLEIQWPKAVPAWIAKEAVQAEAGTAGSVKISGAKVHSHGNPGSAILAKLDKGASVTVVGEAGQWYRVVAPESAVAYIHARYVVTGVQAPAALPAQKPPAHSEVSKKISAPTTGTEAGAAAKPIDSLPDVETSALESRRLEDAQEALRAAEAKKKADAEEQTRRAAEAKRLEDAQEALRAAETKKKADAEEQARRAADAKRLEDAQEALRAAEAKKKADAEERTRRAAEAKRLEDAQEALRAAEAKKKADAEERTRRAAEAKRLEDAQEALLVAEAKKKADAEEQARHAADAKRHEDARRALSETAKKNDDVRNAHANDLFRDPDSKAAGQSVRPAELPQAKPEPRALNVSAARTQEPDQAPAQIAPSAEAAVPLAANSAAVPLDDAHAVKQEEPASAFFEFVPDSTRRIRSKYILPGQEPGRPGSRAEVLQVPDADRPAASAPPARTTPAKRCRPPADNGFPALPSPSAPPPASFRLAPHFETQVKSSNPGGSAISADGTLERVALSPVQGASHALIRNGVTLYYLSSRPGLNLDTFIGQRVGITGAPMQGSASSATALEVGSITARE